MTPSKQRGHSRVHPRRRRIVCHDSGGDVLLARQPASGAAKGPVADHCIARSSDRGSNIQPSDDPEEARCQGWSGNHVVGVVVAADEKIKQVWVRKTSGFPLLDAGVAHGRSRSHPVDTAATAGREVNVSVPVGFYIRDV